MTRNLILFDIDGVLADDTHRVPQALTGNWAAYFWMATEDPVILDGLALAVGMAADPNNEVQYLTGRRVDMYEVTKEWLGKNGFPNPERITMRGFADRDILAKYKAGVIGHALNGGEFDSVHLYEDDPAVVNYVNEVHGTEEEPAATLVPWGKKNPAMVKHAIA